MIQVKAQINKVYNDIEVHVCNNELTDKVEGIVKEISKLVNENITGYDENGAKIIDMTEIIRFYAENQKVLLQTKEGIYSIHSKLYELETKLNPEQFVRISKSEIVNIRKIKRLDTNVTGTIKVILQNGLETYTSRRNVTKLKQILGI